MVVAGSWLQAALAWVVFVLIIFFTLPAKGYRELQQRTPLNAALDHR